MKHRIWTLLFALVLMLSLSACGEAPSEGTEPGEAQTSGGEAETAQKESEESVMNGSGDLGDYHVEVKGAALTADHEGAPVIVITYAWTNNSEDTTSAMISLLEKAFQDGVELETAFLFNNPSYDAEASSKDIRPGTTLDVQCAFILSSETSPVEFELSEAFSFSSDKITMDFDPAGLS